MTPVLFLVQRLSAAVLALAVTAHLATILYAIRGGLTAGEILARTHGNLAFVAFYSLCGEGLCIGYDSADPVSPDYTGRFDYTGGHIDKVIFDVAEDAYIDLERQLAAAIARD